MLQITSMKVLIPPAGNNLGITEKLRALKVGDNVFIAGRIAAQMSGYIRNAKMTGKLTMRTQDGGVRVWRIK